ncbi:type IV pilus biogenesis protein PilC [Mycoplasma sp. CAG:776]|nr:type IV pilus biogenesis protein PilC [Mycoplasma sp. CAG:776]
MGILLAPFTFIISFIKHFFIGVKFVFFDVWYNIIDYQLNKKSFKKKEQAHLNAFDEVIKMDNEEQSVVLSMDERNRIMLEKQELLKEMQLEINSRKVSKDYYYYYGTDKNGRKVKGMMSATNRITLHNFLANEGIDVYQVKKASMVNFLKKIGLELDSPMKTKDLIFWLTQVCTYLKAGLTLNDTIHIMKEQASKDKKKKRLYEAISYELTLGESFSTALQNQGKIFPPLLINMIRSAEATGEIIKTLDDMANYYTEIDKTRKEMISAIIYPAILLIFSIAILTFIMVYVIPEFIQIYDQAGITVSGFTLSIINLSKYITANINMILIIAFLVLLVLLFLYKNSKEIRKIIQSLGMHIPFFGKIIIYHELTLFTKTFASLLRNSVYITDSMEILSNITNNEVYKDIMIETISNIARGDKISKSFYNKWCVPDVAYYMIVTGEATGELSLMMEKVASYFNDLHKTRVTNLKSFLEPIMIVILALIVGVVILAVVIPMFSLYGQIG